jgi:hypothetical protein
MLPMKRNFTLLFLLLCSTLCFAQPKKFSYLAVQIDLEHPDHNFDNWYYSINSGDSTFIKMYGLREHHRKRDKTIAYYYDQKDSTKPRYNCFRSINEAFFFLGEEGWELVAVNNLQPYGSSAPTRVYYFKRPPGE